jgi:hypothetical protein
MQAAPTPERDGDALPGRRWCDIEASKPHETRGEASSVSRTDPYAAPGSTGTAARPLPACNKNNAAQMQASSEGFDIVAILEHFLPCTKRARVLQYMRRSEATGRLTNPFHQYFLWQSFEI